MAGRPEKPIPWDARPHVRRLAEELRELRDRAGTEKLTLRRMSARTSLSTTVLSRATSGDSVPSASTLDILAKALGASPKERAELHQLRAKAEREATAQKTHEDAEATDAGLMARHPRLLLDAAREAGQKHLLTTVYAAAGAPSVRDIAERTTLPRSTVHRALTGQSMSGARKVAYDLIAQLEPEDRDDWTAMAASTFGDTVPSIEEPPLVRAKHAGQSAAVERAFSEFTHDLRRLRNMMVHGEVEADAQFLVQVLALDRFVEDRSGPPFGAGHPDWRPAHDYEVPELTEAPRKVLPSYDDLLRDRQTSEEASSHRGGA
ncbi:helix-turn-helix transcriptional regulator [Streptomyces griseus]|uniref:helix-turn-helix domain-containing protein n=1 Tax=Streptomyces griseus TaxID=1911 RepID=UPI00340C1545